MPNIIKICGLTEPQSIAACLRVGATHLGFVFHPQSPRNVTYERAANLANVTRGMTKSVALVANPSQSLLQDILVQVRPDIIQFHGNETSDQMKKMRDLLPNEIEIWKAIGVSSETDFVNVADFSPYIDKLLFDARPPKRSDHGQDRLGGHGVPFDWEILKAYKGSAPWILAGGLTPDNVAKAITIARQVSGFTGVDVSSGVESSLGKKDDKAIESFIRNAIKAMDGV